MNNLPEGEKPFYKDGTEFCNECPGRHNDHADYCKVPEKVEAAKRAVIEKEQADMETEQ